MVACPGHIFESTKVIEIKLGLYIDGNAVHKNHTPTLYIYSYLPIATFFIMVARPGHILESIKGLQLNLVHT